MKLKTTANWRRAAIGALLTAFCIVPAAAQQQQQRRAEKGKITPEQEQLYVVSAKAGGVNFASGAVYVERAATKQRQVLAKGDEIADADNISVGATGKIELLLNPGSFLRLAENTELEFATTDLENLELKLKTGSALLEASAVGGDDGAVVTVKTPQALVNLEKSGIYRLNVTADTTEIYVWRGAARVGSEIVKGGRKIVIGTKATLATAKFDKDDERDSLDIWSKTRAKELAKLNDNLQRRELSRAFTGVGGSSFGRFGGYWVRNRFTGDICYVPFGFDYWDSPYGYGYNRGIWWGYGRNPVVIYPPPVQTYDPNGSREQQPPRLIVPIIVNAPNPNGARPQ